MGDERKSKTSAPPRYRDKRTARFADGERVKEFQAFEEQAKKRLVILQSAVRFTPSIPAACWRMN